MVTVDVMKQLQGDCGVVLLVDVGNIVMMSASVIIEDQICFLLEKQKEEFLAVRPLRLLVRHL